MKSMSDQTLRKAILPLLAFSLLIGIGAGLVAAWQIWPVRWYDTDPADLKLAHQMTYVVMVADSYAITGDAQVAKARLDLLMDEDTSAGQVANLVERVAEARADEGDAVSATRIRRMGEMAGLPSAREEQYSEPTKALVTSPTMLGYLLFILGAAIIMAAVVIWVLSRRRTARPTGGQARISAEELLSGAGMVSSVPTTLSDDLERSSSPAPLPPEPEIDFDDDENADDDDEEWDDSQPAGIEEYQVATIPASPGLSREAMKQGVAERGEEGLEELAETQDADLDTAPWGGSLELLPDDQLEEDQDSDADDLMQDGEPAEVPISLDDELLAAMVAIGDEQETRPGEVSASRPVTPARGERANPERVLPVTPNNREKSSAEPALQMEGLLGTFEAEYRYGDDDFDCSFSIEAPNGTFLGECGIGISDVLGMDGDQQVDAFEIWLFDKGDIRTVTKLLVSEYAVEDDSTNARLTAKGELVVAAPDLSIELETLTLCVMARLKHYSYVDDELAPDAYFEHVEIDILVRRM